LVVAGRPRRVWVFPISNKVFGFDLARCPKALQALYLVDAGVGAGARCWSCGYLVMAAIEDGEVVARCGLGVVGVQLVAPTQP